MKSGFSGSQFYDFCKNLSRFFARFHGGIFVSSFSQSVSVNHFPDFPRFLVVSSGKIFRDLSGFPRVKELIWNKIEGNLFQT